MLKILFIIFMIWWLFNYPKSFFKTAIIFGAIAFIFSHPVILALVIIVIIMAHSSSPKNENNHSNTNQQKQSNQRTNYNSNNQKQQTNQNKNQYRYFNDCNNLQQLKKRHRELCMKLHPDRGGDINVFRQMQEEYEMLKGKLK